MMGQLFEIFFEQHDWMIRRNFEKTKVGDVARIPAIDKRAFIPVMFACITSLSLRVFKLDFIYEHEEVFKSFSQKGLSSFLFAS